MPTILVSGAASGLGRAFLDAYSSDKSNTVLVIDREDVDLSVYQEHPATIKSYLVDVTDESVGIRGLVPAVENAQPDSVAAAETMDVMDLSTLMHTFQVNAAATFLLLRALLPKLKQASAAKVVIMSSRMGSVGCNTTGSAYAYRASKAALNSMIKSFSIDVPEVIFILCHPGRVESRLVKYKEEGAITAEESVTGLLPLIQDWNTKDSGGFYDRFGQAIEW
ncbi:NAD(P)-binding protein [Aureobasidium subglaciale]|nr:NAD(P)-binding protein [Aureobasidium subglaciale]